MMCFITILQYLQHFLKAMRNGFALFGRSKCDSRLLQGAKAYLYSPFIFERNPVKVPSSKNLSQTCELISHTLCSFIELIAGLR